MAQRTHVELVDDITGGPAEETVSFGLDGRGYEIDLSSDNASNLRQLYAPYIDAGRRLKGGRQADTARVFRNARPAAGDPDPATVRAWAASEGYEVSVRGRVSREIRAAYDAAHP